MNYYIDSVYVDDLQDNTPFICSPMMKENQVVKKTHIHNNIVLDKLDN